jgi:acetolactate synthase I/III small subunit
MVRLAPLLNILRPRARRRKLFLWNFAAGSPHGLRISHTQEQHGPPGMTMQHLLSALVQDQPGVLAHISGMLASRGFNIDSLAVAKCERPRMSRMIFVVNGDDNVLDQVRKQLEKIVPVVEVHDISTDDFVERELMLIKIAATPEKRAEISLLVEMFRGRVVDISPQDLIVEIAGNARKLDAFVELLEPYGLREEVRTGRIALVRSRPKSQEDL